MNRGSSLLRNYFANRFLHIRGCAEYPNGIKYPGFVYYPRSENFKDEPYEPSKLFLIRRIKSMRGTTKTEKKLMGYVNIDGHTKNFGHMNVVKNIPAINEILWKIKHLIEIRPITYKNELPKDGDYLGTYLRETGELIMSPKLKVSPEQLTEAQNKANIQNKFHRVYLRDYLKKKWLNGHSGTV